MSEWTQVKGTHNSKRVSMRKLVQLVLGNDELCFDRQIDGHSFSFSFSASGSYATKKLEAVASEFKKLDKNARLQMEAQISYYV